MVSSHTYSTIILPTVEGSVINLRKAGIPENIHQQIYKELGPVFTFHLFFPQSGKSRSQGIAVVFIFLIKYVAVFRLTMLF